MPAESKKLDTKCPETFGGEIGGLSFAATHSALISKCLADDANSIKQLASYLNKGNSGGSTASARQCKDRLGRARPSVWVLSPSVFLNID